jgi:hypothetical protein
MRQQAATLARLAARAFMALALFPGVAHAA